MVAPDLATGATIAAAADAAPGGEVIGIRAREDVRAVGRILLADRITRHDGRTEDRDETEKRPRQGRDPAAELVNAAGAVGGPWLSRATGILGLLRCYRVDRAFPWFLGIERGTPRGARVGKNGQMTTKRLTPMDAMFLYGETPQDDDARRRGCRSRPRPMRRRTSLRALVRRSIPDGGAAPWNMKPKTPPGFLPSTRRTQWVEDPTSTSPYHVRRSALPHPGTSASWASSFPAALAPAGSDPAAGRDAPDRGA